MSSHPDARAIDAARAELLRLASRYAAATDATRESLAQWSYPDLLCAYASVRQGLVRSDFIAFTSARAIVVDVAAHRFATDVECVRAVAEFAMLHPNDAVAVVDAVVRERRDWSGADLFTNAGLMALNADVFDMLCHDHSFRWTHYLARQVTAKGLGLTAAQKRVALVLAADWTGTGDSLVETARELGTT